MLDNLVEVQSVQVDGLPCVRVCGEIDINTAPLMKQHLDEVIDKEPQHVLVDFSGVRYVDSTGLGALVGCRRRLQAKGGRMSLICTNQHVLKLFEITGLSQLFDLYASEAEVRAQAAAARNLAS